MSKFATITSDLTNVSSALNIVSTISSFVSAGSTVAAGRAQQEAFDREAALQEEQGRIARREAGIEAERTATERRKFLARQKLAFIKNGVSLEGSPLLVLEETRSESQKEVDAIIKSGNAQQRLFFRKAAISRSKGRAAILGSVGKATPDIFDTLTGAIDIFGTISTKPKVKASKPSGRAFRSATAFNPGIAAKFGRP